VKEVNRRRMKDDSSHNVWRSYSDMMSGLLLLFVLIMAVCLMQAQKNYNDKLAEQASRAQTQEELDKTRVQLNEQESELEAQSLTLTDLQSALEIQAAALAEKESELEASLLMIAEQESELEAQAASLAQSQELLTASQAQLDEQTSLMALQQEKIDQIIGIKADLIESLNQEFTSRQINVEIDEQTGAIVLDSSVLFDYNEFSLTEEGEEALEEILPVYCQVLLSDEYVEYVAEIIIDGYTDSTGSYIHNLSLSQNRAFAVAEYLLTHDSFLNEEQQQNLAEKLTANGRSSSNLIYDENGEEDADASRRVEIKFRLKDEEMMDELSQIIADSNLDSAAETSADAGSAADAAADSAAEASAAAETAGEVSAEAGSAADSAAEASAEAGSTAETSVSTDSSGAVIIQQNPEG